MSGLRIARREGIALVYMEKARGNAIDEPFVQELADAAHSIDSDPGVRGVLLASSHPKLFSPGLDLVALVDYKREALEGFMTKFAAALWALYGLRKPVVAAISGHAVAGGCVLALTADYRVLRRDGAQIGLNEVKVGVPLPWTVAELLRASVPAQSLSKIALLGRNFAGEEALAAGLVDELADADGFEEACLKRLAEFAEKDLDSLAETKAHLRQTVLGSMRTREADHVRGFLDCWFSPGTQARIRQTVDALQKKA